jgi:PEP-CTERM motif
MGKGLRLATLVLALVLVTSPARADKLALTGGTLDLDVSVNATGPVQLTGDRGFSFTGFMHGTGGLGDPLPPGTAVTLQIGAVGLDLPGTATLDGTTYTDVGGASSDSSARLRFSTTVLLPAVVDAPATIIAPFALDFILFVGGTGQGTPFFGTGTARIFLDQNLGLGVPSWGVTGIRADVSNSPAPVPEPATLLLLGGGLAGVGLTRLRRKRR